ncbi:MAG: signal peptidase type [Firmicutes bacterium]|nr:signal peptidase type [Bacillota bacterium]
MKASMRILGVLLNVALVLIIAAGAILGFTGRRSPDGIPTVAGRKVLSVLSGSMEPAIHTGDVILVQPLAADQQINDGDVITFRVREKPDMLITHRVAGTVLVNGQPVAYTTKGDANPTVDSEVVVREQLVGRVQLRVPYFGYVSAFLHKPIGIVVCVILPGLILIGLEFRKIWSALAEQEAAKAASAQASGGDKPAE